MKVVKIFFGSIAGLYALAQCFYLLNLLLRQSHISSILGSLSALCVGAALSFALFRSAFPKDRSQ
jgi:hypothetical protein